MPIMCHLKLSPVKLFKWNSEGFIKHRRRPNELHYNSFTYGNLKVEVDDFVLVRNDEAMDPESEENCFVAKVLDLYETDDKIAPYKAKVQWYTRIFELPPQFTRNLPQKDYLQEVIEDHRRSQFSDVIDAESIFSVNCVVLTAKEDIVTKPAKRRDIRVFYCRYKFNGSAVIPLIPSDNKKNSKDEDFVFSSASKRKNETHLNNTHTSGEIANVICTPTRRAKVNFEEQKFYDNYGLKSIKICLPKLENELLDNLSCKTPTPKKNGLTKSLTELHLMEEFSKTPKSFKLNQLKKELEQVSNGMDSKFSQKLLTQSDIKKEKKNSKKQIHSKTSTKQEHVTEEISPGNCVANVNDFTDNFMTAKTETQLCNGRNSVSEIKVKSLRRSLRKANANLAQTVPSKKISEDNTQIENKPANRKRNAKRSLNFESKTDAAQLNSVSTTTRYGRQVKPVNSIHESELDALLLTPRKNLSPQKFKTIRKNTNFYHSDESDNESAYIPSGESSEDEAEMIICSENEKSNTKRKSKNNIFVKDKVRTPRSTKKSRVPVTPTIPVRKEPVKTPRSLLEESRQRLHVSAIPSSLPCREEEFFDIFSFVRSNLLNRTGGCMYVSGVPGTGKTATVHEVIRNLKKERALDHLPSFQFIEVNGMKMTDPYQCYVQIFQKLTGERVMPQQAAILLEKRFTQPGPKNKAVVLLVDELDKLWTRKQTVMYNLFDWPSKPGSKLIVVAIANTMDLPERIMMNRISSRLGLTRMTFQPYTFNELQEIVMSRIREFDVFNPDAVQLVARKVAAISGDARRALEICRRATEIVEEGSVQESPTKKRKMLIGMAHVDVALNQMFSSPVIAAIRGSSELQKMFLKAILSEFQRTGSEETDLRRCQMQLIPLCRFEGLSPPSSSDVSKLCVNLACSSILLVDNIQNDLHMKIRLNVSIDDVTYALT